MSEAPFDHLAPRPNVETRERATVRVRLLRPLYFAGRLRKEGEIVEVTEFHALDLLAIKRAERA